MIRRAMAVPFSLVGLFVGACGSGAPLAVTPTVGSEPTVDSHVQQRNEEAEGKGMIYLTREEIMAGAGEEGAIVVSPGLEEGFEREYGDAFTTAYPIIEEFRWDVVTGTAASERLANELVAGASNVDVFHITAGNRENVENAGVFAPYDLKAMSEDGQLHIPERMIDATGTSVWFAQSIRLIVYNTDLINEADAPTNWDGCLDPRWSGAFYVDTKGDGITPLLPAWGEKQLLDYARDLDANSPIYIRGGTLGLTRMMSGEAAMYCGVNYNSTKRILDEDPSAPLQMVFPDPLAVVRVENEAINANGDNPHAALLWLEFLASPEAQALMDSLDPGKGSMFTEGTVAYDVLQGFEQAGGEVSLCDVECALAQPALQEKVVVEAWGFPNVAYDPEG